MKKFFQNTIVKCVVALTAVALVCGGLVGLVNFFTAPIIADNQQKKITKLFEDIVPNLGDTKSVEVEGIPSSVTQVVETLDGSGNQIGYGFVASGPGYKNNTVEIVVATDKNGAITGIAYSALDDNYLVSNVKEPNLQAYVGGLVTDQAPSGTIISGATKTKDAVASIIGDIGLVYQKITEGSIPDEWYGNAELQDDPTFTPTAVLSRKVYKDGETIVGYQYTATGSGIAQDGSEEKEIVMTVDVDVNGIFKEYEFTTYEHSKGNYKRRIDDQLKTILETNLKTYDDTALVADSTNSWILVNGLLGAIKVEVNK